MSNYRATYHPKGYGVSEGLKRAREPFRFRNAITGTSIMLFAGSVYWYSINAVKQDDFSDVILDVNSRAAISIEDEKREKERIAALKAELVTAPPVAERPTSSGWLGPVWRLFGKSS